ncbi:uncharacterized protein AMSG_02085 [Thecamonas trahens ATCC 50062]|uniref:Uncharacterized protein n=1 Tax=Thecamonas trahens ATCC 50062 TaxID=461836 RepID=A0A0L0DX32_THETB|nr:hypothetical protein AMSG_02085 [Thecamonas trahens ATCC 50062]KNC56073.1 hypothetical protein AMSG_02085 [Thecamonas trahens ATCC 50062]|eukprot:XP_013761117.1 hypothetical protein AMSG_02085 [Thecamonas trahens ATCC 50062]
MGSGWLAPESPLRAPPPGPDDELLAPLLPPRPLPATTALDPALLKPLELAPLTEESSEKELEEFQRYVRKSRAALDARLAASNQVVDASRDARSRSARSAIYQPLLYLPPDLRAPLFAKTAGEFELPPCEPELKPLPLAGSSRLADAFSARASKALRELEHTAFGLSPTAKAALAEEVVVEPRFAPGLTSSPTRSDVRIPSPPADNDDDDDDRDATLLPPRLQQLTFDDLDLPPLSYQAGSAASQVLDPLSVVPSGASDPAHRPSRRLVNPRAPYELDVALRTAASAVGRTDLVHLSPPRLPRASRARVAARR